MLVSNSLHDSMPLRAPTFYSLKFTDYDPSNSSIAIAMCVAIILGGIHCVAWSFHFPSLQERLAWRISAATVVGSPILVLVLATLFGIIGKVSQSMVALPICHHQNRASCHSLHFTSSTDSYSIGRNSLGSLFSSHGLGSYICKAIESTVVHNKFGFLQKCRMRLEPGLLQN